jgi:hypothetical protein
MQVLVQKVEVDRGTQGSGRTSRIPTQLFPGGVSALVSIYTNDIYGDTEAKHVEGRIVQAFNVFMPY